MTKMRKLSGGISSDAIMLLIVKLVTTALGLIITRLLSEYLTVYDYGTYSQILLVVSTVSSVTVLGMMDGINYFYCREQDQQRRESYVATVFALQSTLGTAVGCVVMALSTPLCLYFENSDIKALLIFAAALPVLQNLMGMFQILLVSVGRAGLLAVRNLVVSLLRLAVVLVVVTVAREVWIILLATVLLDVGQITVFWAILRRHNCHIRLTKVKWSLLGEILRYCAPMAVFTVINALNRDLDKYVISLWMDTETLAMYANASKPLPFDILMTSFCTVLIPHITRLIAVGDKKQAAALYKVFLEIAYMSTAVLCCAALAASPQLMKLLYSNKYTDGLRIFCIYILVDLMRFTNITLVLSAAGKTRQLMAVGIGSLVLNGVLNVALYHTIGILGPAIATLLATIVAGVLMLYFSAEELGTKLYKLFDGKYLWLFLLESVFLTTALIALRHMLELWDVHYFLTLIMIAGLYGIVMILLNGKRLFNALRNVNQHAPNAQ